MHAHLKKLRKENKEQAKQIHTLALIVKTLQDDVGYIKARNMPLGRF